ncbi:root allergen protein-like protein [Tanacetum coccineum]|uniref:Root allergen protein-like protein n=1 Tax=Tanacetum coccineum TaxID=301880 RepID=A0ABQ5CRZ8_9ASTR
MTTATIEVEVASSHSAEKVFKVLCDFDAIAPKVNPSVFKSIETIEGNGAVGTVKLISFGDGVPFTTGKSKVDVVDASNFTYSYTFFEGDVLMGIANSITHSIKITPSANGGSVYKQTVTYNCISDEKPSEEALNFEKAEYEKTFKAMEAYAAAQS